MRFGIGRAGILKYEMEVCFRFIGSGRRIGLLRVIMIEGRWILWSLDDFVMKRLIIFVVLLASSSWAGQKLDTTTASTPDDRIVDQVRVRLAGDPDIKGGTLEVNSKDGVVVIKGRVETEKDKAKATKVAKKVKGVKSVDNELSVGPPA